MDGPLDELLHAPEGKTLEFKRDLSSPRNVIKTLVAFANSAGGRLIIGVADDRQLISVADPLDEEERICNLIADSIAPRLVPNVELISQGDRTVLAVEVFPSGNRPHHVTALGPEHGVYVRLGSSNRQAGPDLIAELQRSARGVVFDEMSMPALSLDDLDLAAAQKLFGDRRQLDEKSLTTLKLARREQNRLVPTQGAILLFGKDREQYFPDAWVQCGRFRGTDKVQIFDQVEIHEHLPQAADSIEFFLKKHAFKSAQFGAIRREDVWSIPLTILREAIINALVHSDYSQRGSPIRIAFFDDRIDIESPGLLLPGMTVEDMKSGVSRIRNPVIARVFRELGMIEQWGSGVKRIFDQAKTLGLPEPAVTEIATGVRLSVFLGDQKTQTSTAEQDTQPNGQVSEQVNEQVSEQVVILLTHCLEADRSKQDLLTRLGLSNAYLNYKRHIVPLLERGLLEQTIPDKPRSRLQKYRLTAAGRGVLQSAKNATRVKKEVRD